MSVSSEDFRGALSHLPSGVCLVTTRSPEGRPVALTISSLTSLSLDPPRILFCLSKRSATLPFFELSRHFLVHILTGDQADLADGFANIIPISWDDVPFTWEGEGICPLIAGTKAHMECQVSVLYDGGDHTIVVGDVISVQVSDESAKTLVRYKREYGEL